MKAEKPTYTRRELKKNLRQDIRQSWKTLGISNDFMFGKVMRDPVLCRQLLERILPDMKIDRIEYTQTQKSIYEDAYAHGVRLDVYVKDADGVCYDLEIQAVDTGELPQRSRYYQSMMDLEMLDSGRPYYELARSYVIFICRMDIFGHGRHIYTFANRCREEEGLELGDGAVKIFLNARGTMDDVGPGLHAFLKYVDGTLSNDPYVKKLELAVRKARMNRKWRNEYMTIKMKEQLTRHLAREEGREEGWEQVARAMLQDGKSNSEIQKYIPISDEKLNDIRREMK